MMRDPVQTIGNLIDKQSVAYIGSVDGEGFPNVKAMLPPRKREGDTMYYPGGVTDPDYCVLRITVTRGRCYSNFGSGDFPV